MGRGRGRHSSRPSPTSPRFSVVDRVRLLLFGVGVAAAGIRWFRWCFSTVSALLAYAADGDVTVSVATLLVWTGLILAALAGAGLWVTQRPSASSC